VSIATTEAYKDKQTGEKKEVTEWHNLSFFGRLAEIVEQYVFKGSMIYVEGSLKTRKYTDKEGIEKYSTGVMVSSMKMLGGKQGETSAPKASNPSKSKQSEGSGFEDMDSDIPF
jgi:single-strand DNA-binding protein